MSARTPADPYTLNLDKCAANYQPLTPLTFLRARGGGVSDASAVDPRQRSGSAMPTSSPLPAAGLGAGAARIGVGDTVTVMLANTPAMLEAHYGVPMTGAVLHSLNTRLDAAVIAFQLDHAEAKVRHRRPRVRTAS